MNNYNEFKKIVEKMHIGQKYNNNSYMYHLEGTCDILIKYLGMHPRVEPIKLMCLGHDLLEDTEMNETKLEEYVSLDIIEVIKLLTDKNGKNRKERHMNTYYLLREKEEAVIVKLCDRLFHLNQNTILPCYYKEKDTFKFALYDKRHSYARILWEVYDKSF